MLAIPGIARAVIGTYDVPVFVPVSKVPVLVPVPVRVDPNFRCRSVLLMRVPLPVPVAV